eukprot:scaffold16292_cov51-Phaeocystis_antarctica.AAC.2
MDDVGGPLTTVLHSIGVSAGAPKVKRSSEIDDGSHACQQFGIAFEICFPRRHVRRGNWPSA